MKRTINLLLMLLMAIASTQVKAQGDPNKAAEDIVKAYKEKDATLLKRYATGILINVINDNFFESKDAKTLVEIAKGWDGTIREIRYAKGDIMGSTVIMANVYIGDNPSGELNTVLLTSYNNSDWKAFGLGITETSRKEFLEGSLEIPKDEPKTKPKADKAYKGFSIEMANGETLDNPTVAKLRTMLKTIDDDNFFLTLSGKDGFLQTTISETGFIVQHSEGEEMFEAESYFTMEKLVEIFEAYLRSEDWKSMGKWAAM
ncbi:MAG: hypothetical protein PHD06_09050 [Bacteroidales bacterium]|nr:hypothetical protein [Bacteroidales bacterium]MDD4385310.1 hypothetical protein [Bacteroidales bacterium]MDY0198256.1 hypothetical protein [Tenuifilaceae bacterium]